MTVRSPVSRRARPALALLAALGLVLAACGGNGSEPAVEPAPEPEPERNPGVIVEVLAEDIATGFEEINFYHDIPGLLLESDDPVLSGLGSLASEAGRSDGQGFANLETGELVFVITVVLNSLDDAHGALDYIAAQTVETIFQFISPDETLFDRERLADPRMGERAVRYSLRYGSEEGGRRTRDVATDLIIFTTGGSLVFVLQSVTTGDKASAAGQSVDLVTLSRTISDRIVDEQAAAPEPSEMSP